MGNISNQLINEKIHFIRGHRVIIDADLAELYGIPTKALKQAVRRNLRRFPADFMFELSSEEYSSLRSQFVTLENSLRGKHSKYSSLAFTEQGVAMLSSVLKSDQAIEVNIEIMRAFVRMKRIFEEHKDLARKLQDLEKKYNAQFKAVFDAIRQLMAPTPMPTGRRRLGLRKTD